MTASILTPDLRAVFFDAVGTLIIPEPPAADRYAAVGRQHGCALPRAEIARRFHAAFQHEEDADRAAGWIVDEARELRRWRNIVARVFHEAGDARTLEAIFAELYAAFAQPGAWRLAPHAEVVIPALVDRGFTLGVASNFDRRLHAVLNGFPALATLGLRIISSEIGFRKPHARFYFALTVAANCPASQILYIGDQTDNDYHPALAAGLQAIQLSPDPIPNIRTIQSLNELL